MASDTRELDAAAVGRLEALIEAAGGRQQVATRMAVANGRTAPSKDEIESQALRLTRITNFGRATMKSLKLVAAAIEKPLGELLSFVFQPLFPSPAPATAEPDAGKSSEAEKSSSHWRAPETETGRLYRLNRASELTANRTNIVRDESGFPLLTLQDQLYVRRDIEDEIARALEQRSSELSFIVIDGEAGTGKSSVLWASERMLNTMGADAWLIDAIELEPSSAPHAMEPSYPSRSGSFFAICWRRIVRRFC